MVSRWRSTAAAKREAAHEASRPLPASTKQPHLPLQELRTHQTQNHHHRHLLLQRLPLLNRYDFFFKKLTVMFLGMSTLPHRPSKNFSQAANSAAVDPARLCLNFGVAMAGKDSFLKEMEVWFYVWRLFPSSFNSSLLCSIFIQLCLMCGSHGVHEVERAEDTYMGSFLRCRDCCEPYHPYCVGFTR